MQQKAKPAAKRQRQAPQPFEMWSDFYQQWWVVHLVVLREGFLHEELRSRIKYATSGTSTSLGKALLPPPPKSHKTPCLPAGSAIRTKPSPSFRLTLQWPVRSPLRRNVKNMFEEFVLVFNPYSKWIPGRCFWKKTLPVPYCRQNISVPVQQKLDSNTGYVLTS